MGYRSQVVIAIDNEYTTELEALLKDADNVVTNKNHTVYQYNSVKWYESYPEIASIMANLELLDEDNYGFIKLGEDLDDIEIKGTPYLFNIGVTRIIDIEGGGLNMISQDFLEQNIKTCGIEDANFIKLLEKFKHIPLFKKSGPFWDTTARAQLKISTHTGVVKDICMSKDMLSVELITVLLHEFGHVIDLENKPYKIIQTGKPRLKMEIRAWTQAFKLAKIYKLNIDVKTADEAIGSYGLTHPKIEKLKLETLKVAA